MLPKVTISLTNVKQPICRVIKALFHLENVISWVISTMLTSEFYFVIRSSLENRMRCNSGGKTTFKSSSPLPGKNQANQPLYSRRSLHTGVINPRKDNNVHTRKHIKRKQNGNKNIDTINRKSIWILCCVSENCFSSRRVYNKYINIINCVI